MKSDIRLGDLFQQSPDSTTQIRLYGFPSDAGVRINGGRTGAAEAPEKIFEQLNRLTPHPGLFLKHCNLLGRTSIPESMPCSGDVKANQAMLSEKLAITLKRDMMPVIVGGGHETAFGHFLGYAKAGKEVHIMNIDAHTDVRHYKDGKPHSGSPFRQSVEHLSGLCRSYNVFGLNPATVSEDHLKFVDRHGTVTFDRDTTHEKVLERLAQCSTGSVMITMDMDAVSQADAPGVSAPNGSGLSRELWLRLAYEFGKQPSVSSFDLCEVNPRYDRDDQTVRLAAMTIWNFLLGVAEREPVER